MCSINNMNKKMNVAYIALGANLSNPETTFRQAVAEMSANEIDILAASSLWHSPAWPAGSGHPDYVNAALKVSTSLGAAELLRGLHALEAQFGRERQTLNAPRSLDLDIIDYAGQVRPANPILPHPRSNQRAFVLLPLLEIDAGWEHPESDKSALELLAELPSKDVLQHAVIKRDWLNS